MKLDAPPALWWKSPIPKQTRACYATKTAALIVFADANRDLIQNYGGMNYEVSPSEFDAVNHKYSLKGKQAARSISEALWAALPAQKRPPYCLEDIDIGALNDTSPAREYELGFRLPDWAEEDRLIRQQEAWYRDDGMAGRREKPWWVVEARAQEKARAAYERSMKYGVFVWDPTNMYKAVDAIRIFKRESDATKLIAKRDPADNLVVRRLTPDTPLKGFQFREGRLSVGQRFEHFGHIYEIIKIGRDKNRTVQIARRVRDSFGKETLVDHRSFSAREFDRQHLKPLGGGSGGWGRKAPKTKGARIALLKRCGRKAFLQPDKLKFPIISKGSTTCEPDCKGLLAAKQRAAQQGKRKLVAKANQIAKRAGCAWAR